MKKFLIASAIGLAALACLYFRSYPVEDIVMPDSVRLDTARYWAILEIPVTVDGISVPLKKVYYAERPMK